MGSFVELLAAFGFGAIVTALVQTWLAGRSEWMRLRFSERKEAYAGMLKAYHDAAVAGTDEAAKGFAYWQLRCELVAPKAVRDAIAGIVATNENPHARQVAHEKLKSTMRDDLSVWPAAGFVDGNLSFHSSLLERDRA